MMGDSRVHIMRRKTETQDEKSALRKKIVDFFRASTIIDDSFTGSLELIFNQGGIVGSRRIEKDPL